jgi:hypothetical protein
MPDSSDVPLVRRTGRQRVPPLSQVVTELENRSEDFKRAALPKP